MFNWLKERKLQKQKIKFQQRVEDYKIKYQRNPEKPIKFGRNSWWFAIKNNNVESICRFLNISLDNSCNWIEGKLHAIDGNVFILPAIQGWVLMRGRSLEGVNFKTENNQTVALLEKFSSEFGEAQFFGNWSSSSYAEWTMYKNGKLIRHYSIADFQGEQIGEPTEIEKQWKLIDPYGMPEMTDEEHDAFTYASFKEIAIISKEWSINPMEIEEMKDLPTSGYFANYKSVFQ